MSGDGGVTGVKCDIRLADLSAKGTDHTFTRAVTLELFGNRVEAASFMAVLALSCPLTIVDAVLTSYQK